MASVLMRNLSRTRSLLVDALIDTSKIATSNYHEKVIDHYENPT